MAKYPVEFSTAGPLRTLYKNGMTIGKMYFYFYDPKTKDQMPYYDIFPLVIPIDYMPAKKSATGRDSGFLGLNLHYIPPKYRIALLDKLYAITNNSAFNETTKIRLSYRVLQKNVSFFEATPCLKWYLFKQVRSRVLEIDADEWEIAALLPFESFQKQSKQRVWADSRRKF